MYSETNRRSTKRPTKYILKQKTAKTDSYPFVQKPFTYLERTARF